MNKVEKQTMEMLKWIMENSKSEGDIDFTKKKYELIDSANKLLNPVSKDE